jgi:hypothetical protein
LKPAPSLRFCRSLIRKPPWKAPRKRQLEIAADHGKYLRPFAKILLAMAALREKKSEVARAQLSDIAAEFPENPLFANELAKLKVSASAAVSLR